MPNYSTFKHYNLNMHNQKVKSISGFLGVDYNLSQSQVDENHAVDIKNILFRDKVNQKRKGYEQLAKLDSKEFEYNGETFSNPPSVNGIYEFVGEDGTRYLIAHIGHLLCKIVGFGETKNYVEPKYYYLTRKETINGVDKDIVDYKLNNNKSSGFVSDNRLYLLDGNNFYVIKSDSNNDHNISINVVEDDENTYIPTTSVGITQTDALVSNITPLDDVNLMTQWKKNKLVSGVDFDENRPRTTKYCEYELDSPIAFKNENDINDIEVVITQRIYINNEEV